MSWTSEAQRRAVEAVHTGERDFALVLQDGTEYAGPRMAGAMTVPMLVDGHWRSTNTLVEFPMFETSEAKTVEAVAVYDGPTRLVVTPIGPIAVSARVQPVLRPGDLMIGLAD